VYVPGIEGDVQMVEGYAVCEPHRSHLEGGKLRRVV
jgi:hypothetical protein